MKIKALLKANPDLVPMFEASRRSRGRVTSVYDVSTICNLRCDGCLFFDRDGHYSGPEDTLAPSSYREFFEAERLRGVNYPIFAGAEPGLRPEIMQEAAAVWQEGMVHTNATVKFKPNIPFRLYVSIWGHRTATAKWRGADCYNKVLRNITGDERVMVNYTINRANIDDIKPVVEDLAARGVRITFQVYSPTPDYLNLIASTKHETHDYAHDSSASDNLVLRPEDEKRACAVVKAAIDAYPETVVFSHDLADFVFSKPGIFWDDVDHDEVPEGCSVARDERHIHYRADMTVEDRKTCGHPDIDCRTCRAYTTIYTGYFQHKLQSLAAVEGMRAYLEAHRAFHDIFYVN